MARAQLSWNHRIRPMKFYSTRDRTHLVSLREAVVHGLAPDQGLYMPATIPTLSSDFYAGLKGRSFHEIAFDVAASIFGGDVEPAALRRIIDHTLQFDAPLVEVDDNLFALELFHGPTMAFKDFGARFLSRLHGHFARVESRDIVVLVATSGDTGGAVANGFFGVEGTRVVILYPSGKVSPLQEKQFTTLGSNITAVEVNGTFDDCQRLVKEAFADDELNRSCLLTSANSINIARLVPQMFYYFYAFGQARLQPSIFSVPSGNFGNLTAGLMARRMGLPVRTFIAATNANDVVPEFMKTGIFSPRPSIATISNAMDVGNPSNVERMMDLYDRNIVALRDDVVAFSCSDDETREAMRQVYRNKGYILDPHGAVAYLALKNFVAETRFKGTGIFLATAHPAKFKETVESTLNVTIDLPPNLARFASAKKSTRRIAPAMGALKDVLHDVLS